MPLIQSYYQKKRSIMGLFSIDGIFEHAKTLLRRDSAEVSSSSTAEAQLREYFDNANGAVNNEQPPGDIDAMLGAARSEAHKLQGRRPELGLVTPEVREAQNDLQQEENQADQNNINAQGHLDDTSRMAENNNSAAEATLSNAEHSADVNNDQAHSATERAESDADLKVEEAKNNLSKVKSEQQANIEKAQADVDNAESKMSEAQTSYDTAKSALSTAQANVESAQMALSNAKTDEERQAANEQLNQAKQALEQAQKAEQDAKNALENAKKELENAKTKLEQTKQEAENAIADAEERLNTVIKDGELAVNNAKDNESQVRAEGNVSIKSAESNVKNVQIQGDDAVNSAEANLEEVRAEGEEQVEEAESELEDATAETMDTSRIISIMNSNTGSNKNFDKDEYERAINSINPENVLDVMEECPGLRKNQRSNEEYNSDLKKVKDAVLKKAEELGVDTSDLQFLECNSDSPLKITSTTFKNTDALETIYRRCQDAIRSQDNASFADNLYYNNGDAFRSAINHAYNSSNGQTRPSNTEGVDFGNGVIDKTSTQQTGNCWVQAAINSLASTESGSEMLRSNIYRDDKLGVTAVHLKEAENKNKGYNGTGIYTITDAELAQAQKNLSSGDGDMTAYNLALQKYFKESGERQNLDGGRADRIYEIFSGKNFTTGDVGLKTNGVFREKQPPYDEVLTMAQGGKGAISVFIDETGESSFAPVNNHVISVVGATPDGRLLVQESNNVGLYIGDLPRYEGVTYNGAPTYIMDKDQYYARVNQTEYLYWGAS